MISHDSDLIGQYSTDLAERWHLNSVLLQLSTHVVDFLICCSKQQKQENLTNCGTKAADVLDNFLASKLKCNPVNYYDVRTPITAKCCSICYRLDAI